MTTAQLRPGADASGAIARLAGVGNVFRNEALHAIGVHPTRPSRDLTTDQLTRLWSVLQTMMSRAVDDGPLERRRSGGGLEGVRDDSM
ncbi:hypothetical protein E1218_25120 [Kribbella turkmenica]|uniref:Formamidopyrimidine-DNA glycosylase H2TH DNA-binding domain-containing protein n=1 Tax=Kribbella turkmenica TaxID=2530375 RepID=A0A4R4WMN4_9ACTN|nr:hypothetical protein [Kribbella turkmenica]TDD18887.1 hypothetical protein E1218_25120 [Kribbella turkmenica]